MDMKDIEWRGWQKDLTELTDIQGRKLEKRKEQIKHFGAWEVEPEKENIDGDASGKRNSSEMEADRQMSAKMPKTMIETNQQFGAGRVEPEKENIDSDASGKGKSSEMEADGQMSAKMDITKT